MSAIQYTEKRVERMKAEAPLNYEKAQSLASEFGLTGGYRSIIAKAISLGIAYEKKQPASPTKSGPTKSELAGEIRATLKLADREGDLNKSEYLSILEAIRAND